MSGTVAEIMDPDFFFASQNDSIGQLLHDMADLGIGSAPVLDLAGHPMGMATVREIDGCRRVEELSDQLQQPVVSVHQNTPVDVAARTLAEQDTDVLVLVDDRGVAVGALRALDLLRAMLGLRISRGERQGARRHAGSWSRSALLDLESIHHAPAAPGIILLDPGTPGGRPNVVWVEAATNIRERLDEMLRLPQEEPVLEQVLGVHPRTVSFRALVVTDPERRARLLRSLGAVLSRRHAQVVDAASAANAD
jgi:CBS domain-containing protein